MSGLYLGELIDIHSGGQDLIFPHHENEIAQAEALRGKPFVNYWLHNGFINIDKEKMSKSLGNFVNIVELLEYYSADAVRLFILQTHYRSPITFTDNIIDQAQVTADRLFDVILLTKNYADEAEELDLSDLDKNLIKLTEKAREDFIEAMDEDFNTSNGFAVVFKFSTDVNDYLRKAESINQKAIKEADKLFDEFRTVLGLFENFESYLSLKTVEKLVKLLIEIRGEYRKDKNWEMSDKIRDELKAAGIALEDTPKRILWKLSE
jgi:cysteinyl-tRNA synthetase